MKKITIYSTPVCKWCKVAKDYFKTNNLEYTEIDVAGQPAEKNKMVELSGQKGVPVIVIGETVITGYDRSKIEEALK